MSDLSYALENNDKDKIKELTQGKTSEQIAALFDRDGYGNTK